MYIRICTYSCSAALCVCMAEFGGYFMTSYQDVGSVSLMGEISIIDSQFLQLPMWMW